MQTQTVVIHFYMHGYILFAGIQGQIQEYFGGGGAHKLEITGRPLDPPTWDNREGGSMACLSHTPLNPPLSIYACTLCIIANSV